MKIVVLGTKAPALSGGMMMVILIVDALRELGHDAHVIADDAPPAWAPIEVPWQVAEDPVSRLGSADAVLTGFAGVEPALAAGAEVVGHLCVGYEPHLWPHATEKLERVYRLPTVKLVIAPHLRRTLRREAGVESVVVGPPIDLRPFEPGPSSAGAPRVLSVGSDPEGAFAPVPFKGIATVLEIAAAAREGGHALELVRLMPRYDGLAEDAAVDEFHVGIEPAAVPAIYRSCDIYLGGSTAAEGFGMPAVEAAAAGLAGVLPAIPSFSEIEGLDQAALFYAPGDREEALAQLTRVLEDAELRGRLAAAGPRLGLAERYAPRGVAERIAAALADARA
jgi:glycosyltransferase involved in cell wall biosynthesis